MKLISLEPFSSDGQITTATYALDDQRLISQEIKVKYFKNTKNFHLSIEHLRFSTGDVGSVQGGVQALAKQLQDAAELLLKEAPNFTPFE